MAPAWTSAVKMSRFRKISIIIVVALVVLIPLSRALQEMYCESLVRNWAHISSEEEQELSQEIQSQFSCYQDEAAGVVDGIIRSEKLLKILSDGEWRSDSLFDILLSLPRQDLSIELYSAQKELVGWSGTRGPTIDLNLLKETKASFVIAGPIYSHLIVVAPIDHNSRRLGYVVGKRLFEVNYPINNRFINKSAFTSTFTARLNVFPKFHFPPDTRSFSDSGMFPIALNNVEGEKFGRAFLTIPSLSGRLEAVQERFQDLRGFLMLLLVATLLYDVLRWSSRWRMKWVTVIVWSLLIWSFRYAAIWLNFPANIIHLTIFQPDIFASPFGSGLAKSLGDMSVSSVCLFLNSLIVVNGLVSGDMSWIKFRQDSSRILKLLLIIGVVLLSFLVLVFMRGMSATIHSAVFDSSLSFNEPSAVMPSKELSIMLTSLFFVSLSFVSVATGILLTGFRLIQKLWESERQRVLSWSFLAVIVFLSSLMFGALQENPLLSPVVRFIYCTIILGIAVWISFSHDKVPALYGFRVVVPVVLVALLMLIPSLDRQVHELDRAHVELLAREMDKPVDSWSTFLLTQSLDELSSWRAGAILRSGDPDDVVKLAFTEWAKSILSREGNNCSITYVDREGTVVSDFHVGIAAHQTRAHVVEASFSGRKTHTEERSQNGQSVRWYVGFTPLSADHGIVGGVWVELSGGRESLVRNEAPEILRNYSRERFETHFRKLLLSEYFEGKLFSTTSENIPRDRSLPIEIRSPDFSSRGMWLDESFDGQRYESYYFVARKNSKENSVISLSMEGLDARWHLYSFLRYLLFYLSLATTLILIGMIIRFLGGERFTMRFRTKLMFAFIVVSLLPVIVLAYYNREYATERVEETTIKRLNDQTSMVVAEVQHELGLNVPAALAALGDDRCVAIADDLNIDFNVYLGSSLQSSSKPEIFAAELLDSSVTADAYRNIVLKRKSFYTESQAIGNLLYVVGYKPLVAEDGSVLGAVSVPTLYQQKDLEQELTKRNVFLYGAYATALALSLLVGTFLANQISSPLRRLRHATGQLATGNLHVDLHSTRKDEMGDLERAFQQMTRDLRQTQEAMLQAQRELAWKEMAKQVAHEIKNPLTPMRLSIQHLRKAYEDGTKDFGVLLHQVSNTILEQIDALSRIASEFSHFARMPERHLRECSVHEILIEAQNLFQSGDVRFIHEFVHTNPIIKADREELRRAFINIIRNSVHAMGDRGVITLRTSTSRGTFDIEIADSGPGIPPEIQDRLFEPNFSTKTEGMGLGLAIVKKIIVDLGGTITIQSERNVGSTARICLPQFIGGVPTVGTKE